MDCILCAVKWSRFLFHVSLACINNMFILFLHMKLKSAVLHGHFIPLTFISLLMCTFLVCHLWFNATYSKNKMLFIMCMYKFLKWCSMKPSQVLVLLRLSQKSVSNIATIVLRPVHTVIFCFLSFELFFEFCRVDKVLVLASRPHGNGIPGAPKQFFFLNGFQKEKNLTTTC